MMTRRLSFGIAAVLWFLSLRPAQAVAPTPAELAEAKRWSAARFDGADGSSRSTAAANRRWNCWAGGS